MTWGLVFSFLSPVFSAPEFTSVFFVVLCFLPLLAIFAIGSFAALDPVVTAVANPAQLSLAWTCTGTSLKTQRKQVAN